MQYQTFRGTDVTEALDAVRSALGPNAVIESTRQVSNGRRGGLGQGFVEVTASGTEGGRARWPFAAASVSRDAVRTPRRVERAAPRAPRSSLRFDSTMTPNDIEQELRTLRAMFEQLSATRPPRERALAMLQAAGLEGNLARSLATGASRASRRGRDALRNWLLERVRSAITTQPCLLKSDSPRLIAAVGPTGAGKTTTLAKLAAKARLDFNVRVGVISLDTFRVGAVEQWQRYASLMGLPFGVARNTEEFERALSSQRTDLVLVDTPGRHTHDTPESWPLEACLGNAQGYDVNVLVVLPAWLHAQDAERVCEAYACASPTGVVLTKVDESERLGGVLQASISSEIPVTYVCNGPRVPEDIGDAHPDLLIDSLFRLVS